MKIYFDIEIAVMNDETKVFSMNFKIGIFKPVVAFCMHCMAWWNGIASHVTCLTGRVTRRMEKNCQNFGKSSQNSCKSKKMTIFFVKA